MMISVGVFLVLIIIDKLQILQLLIDLNDI